MWVTAERDIFKCAVSAEMHVFVHVMFAELHVFLSVMNARVGRFCIRDECLSWTFWCT